MRHPSVLPASVVCLCAVSGAAMAAPAGAAIEFIGRGVQIYECAAGEGGATWKFQAPEATLFDAVGQVVGHHFAGPTWEALDGSRIVGAPIVASPSPVAGAIPWLVLKAATQGKPGDFAQVLYVTRTNTVGGAALATGCDAAHLGSESRTPYSATYTFFRAAVP